jgi:membrane-associated phospholipid phosphatase/tRNA A-37 threonylcarbamoyl transferase component Bud32
MDLPADRSTPATVQRVQPAPAGALRPARRRRPTGAPPPLPHHLQTSGVGWLVAAVVLVALTIGVFARGLRGPAITATVVDDAVVGWLVGLHAPGLVGVWRVLAALSSWWILYGTAVVLVLALLVLRRFRHLIIWVIVANLVAWVVEDLVGPLLQRPRPFGVVITAGWGGWALPSLQIALYAAGWVTILYSLVPEGRWRNLGKWLAAGLVALSALGRVALGAEAPTDVLVGAAIGVAIALLAFRVFAPSAVFPVVYRRGRAAHLDVGGARGAAIRRALEDQLGLVVEEVKPFGLAGSGGSTPLRVKVNGEPPSYLFAKLYARSHLRADRWYKLGRELLYGRLEDEKPFNTVRRLVQQEDYALHKLHLAGLPTPWPYGFVELTPDREYLLVTEFFDGAVELGEAEVTDQVIDDGLGIIRKLWDAGLAHRDVKPANLLVRDGRLLLIDVAFVEARPSPWRQAVDLANMMLCLGLRCGAERVYRRALRQFTKEEIGEGFAAARGLALPSQLRRLLRARGRDLHAEFIRLLPTPPQPIRIQRWSLRRIGLLAGVLLLVVVLVGNSGVLFDRHLAIKTSLNSHELSCTRPQPLWLEAQSVPSAAMVPCVRSLPVGWTLADVAVNSGRSLLSFDNDRAGPGAMVVQLTAGCDIQGATRVVVDQPGVLRYLRIGQLQPRFAATRLDVFPGGCVTTRLTAPKASRAELTSEAPLILGLTTRQTLRQALEQRSGGRLHLDPSKPR